MEELHFTPRSMVLAMSKDKVNGERSRQSVNGARVGQKRTPKPARKPSHP